MTLNDSLANNVCVYFIGNQGQMLAIIEQTSLVVC